jgi:hypothetical protein
MVMGCALLHCAHALTAGSVVSRRPRGWIGAEQPDRQKLTTGGDVRWTSPVGHGRPPAVPLTENEGSGVRVGLHHHRRGGVWGDFINEDISGAYVRMAHMVHILNYHYLF